jgi:uncharacterized DUF497 family protein
LIDVNRYSKILLATPGGGMGRGKVFQCYITVSSGVESKLFEKHNIEMWEVEEVIYDDPYAFSISYRECYFIYGQTFSGRYLLVLVRILSEDEVLQLGFSSGTNVIKVITARDMNAKQRKEYANKRGAGK